MTKELPSVNRPKEVQESRLKLPVCGMEQEVRRGEDFVKYRRPTPVLSSNTIASRTAPSLLCSPSPPQIVEKIKKHNVLILCGETGSGKSTQLPQFIYESVNDASHPLLIGVTQPRRVAAVSTAKRVAYEMGFGDGYR